METIRCVICKCEKKVVGFKQDDPILECGHILTVRDQELDSIRNIVADICRGSEKEYLDAGFGKMSAGKFAAADVFGL